MRPGNRPLPGGDVGDGGRISYAGTPLFVLEGSGILVNSGADVEIYGNVVEGNRNSYLLGDTNLLQSRWLHANRPTRVPRRPACSHGELELSADGLMLRYRG